MPLSLQSRSDLAQAVIDYLDRPDLADACPAWIALAESRFNGALRAREMEAEAEIGQDAVQAPLPDDFLEWIALAWAGAGRTASPGFVETDSPEARYRHRPGGDPQYFTVSAGRIRLVPPKPGTIVLTYYRTIPPLAADDATNWLLARAPDAYLYATVAEAYIYQKAPDLAQAHLQLASQALGAAGLRADTQKLSRRSGRETEVAASAQAAVRPE